MIRRKYVLGAAAISFALASCGGGSSSPSPSPSPSPTSTATATPTPVSYSAFPLTAATEFGTIDAFTTFDGDLAGATPITLNAAGTESGSTRFRVAALPDPTVASTDTGGTPVVVHENTEESRYNKDQLTVAPATGVKEFVFNNTTITLNGTATTVPFSTAEFLNNTVKDKVTSDTGLALTETSYTGWYRADSAAGQKRITYGAWGYPTVASDMPTTGTATYTARIVGRAVRAAAAGGLVNKLGGTVTINVNFATGFVTFTANVTLIGTGGAETAFGTFTGSGAYASGSTQFSGSFDASSPLSGSISGTFFGSHGAEIGIAYGVSGNTTESAVVYPTRAVGLMVGKKN